MLTASRRTTAPTSSAPTPGVVDPETYALQRASAAPAPAGAVTPNESPIFSGSNNGDNYPATSVRTQPSSTGPALSTYIPPPTDAEVSAATAGRPGGMDAYAARVNTPAAIPDPALPSSQLKSSVPADPVAIVTTKATDNPLASVVPKPATTTATTMVGSTSLDSVNPVASPTGSKPSISSLVTGSAPTALNNPTASPDKAASVAAGAAWMDQQDAEDDEKKRRRSVASMI